ncbi:penicillin-binding transpeptidase domain-containing protein [Schleiferiaceae bacterium]|nr:penicillin-binding transpeptidase domain-containing protein [Schleiferiaceae bacterium]
MSIEIGQIKKRITWISAVVYAFFLIILVRLFYVALVMGPELRAQSQERVIERRPIEAKRGDIYSADGKTLATTKPVYNIHFDALTVDPTVFNEEVSGLSEKLAILNPKRNTAQWERYLRSERDKKHRYIPLAADLNYSQLQRIKTYPILSRGAFQGGLIIKEKLERIQMATDVRSRTIGRDKDGAQAGLEGYYSNYLQGKPGNRLMQKITGNDWKPLDDPQAVEPLDGFDLFTTIDTRIQDVAQQSLLAQLKKYDADHGTAVVMEVATGRIVAMANLGRNADSIYSELRNYAVWERTEPGSTIKLLSAMALLETGVADTSDKVNTENGVVTIYGKKVRDSRKGGYGTISLRKAFEVSSNTGIVKLVQEHFEKHPDDYVDFLYSRGFHKNTGITIKGESAPNIPKPNDDRWSGISLPWMAYGYGVEFTPLQLLTIYNAVANNGTMVKPQIVERIMDHGRIVEDFETAILNPAICSQDVVKKLQAMLEGAVESGTAKNIYDQRVPVAGKTGTCQLNYWRGGKDYQSSFAGYFPANDPQYSCIVVINKPDYYKGYYGNIVAGPVFKAIADEVYSHLPETPTTLTSEQLIAARTTAVGEDRFEQAFQKNFLPSLSGLDARTATRILEGQGLAVSLVGKGRVARQEPALGTPLHQCSTVKLVLR